MKCSIQVHKLHKFIFLLTCQPWSNKLRSTVRNQRIASEGWKSLSFLHLRQRNTPKHLSNSDVDAWMTVRRPTSGPDVRIALGASFVSIFVWDCGGHLTKSKPWPYKHGNKRKLFSIVGILFKEQTNLNGPDKSILTTYMYLIVGLHNCVIWYISRFQQACKALTLTNWHFWQENE